MTRSRADAAPSWVWVAELPARAEFELPADEAHHVTRVCRARPGDHIHVTDGAGRVATAELLSTGARVRVRSGDVALVPRGATLELWCGAPEGERADWLVEKVAELGVARLVLLDTERARWQRAEARWDRWLRLSRAALRQSRQAWALVLEGPDSLPARLARVPDGLRVVATAGAPGPGSAFAGELPAVGAVGPAEGLADGEQAALEGAGFRPVRLAPARLRAETAALALAAAWASRTPEGPSGSADS